MCLGRIFMIVAWIMYIAVFYFCGWKIGLGYIVFSFFMLSGMFQRFFAGRGIGAMPMIDLEAGFPAGCSYKYLADIILSAILIAL